MICWMMSDGEEMMVIPDDIYEEALAVGLGVPSVHWSDEVMQLFMDDREEFNRQLVMNGNNLHFRTPFPVIQGL